MVSARHSKNFPRNQPTVSTHDLAGMLIVDFFKKRVLAKEKAAHPHAMLRSHKY